MATKRRSFDIAVAGCGPAGLAAGLLLVRAGNRVTLFDRMETPAPVGSGLIGDPLRPLALAEAALDPPPLIDASRRPTAPSADATTVE